MQICLNPKITITNESKNFMSKYSSNSQDKTTFTWFER